MSDKTEVYILCFLREADTTFALWYEAPDETDVFAADAAGRILSFPDRASAAAAAADQQMAVSREETVVDLAVLNAPLSPELTPAVSNELLTIWNLADDLAKTLGLPYSGAQTAADALYDKLFRCCALPAMGELPEKHLWTREETAQLSSILREAAALFDGKLIWYERSLSGADCYADHE